MITVNSVSGGKTSSYMAVHYPADINIFACVCIDYPRAQPKDKAVLKYCSDKLNGNFIASAEREKTLVVMMQLEQLLGKEIVWVRGKSFDQIIDGDTVISGSPTVLPTWAHRFCTTELKIVPIFEYCYFNYGKVIENIGFRADEPDRIFKARENNTIKYPVSCNNYLQRRKNWQEIEWTEKVFPLSQTFHFEIRSWWIKNHPEFIFPKDSNCVGCHHKSEDLIRLNYEDDPEILEWFAMWFGGEFVDLYSLKLYLYVS